MAQTSDTNHTPSDSPRGEATQSGLEARDGVRAPAAGAKPDPRDERSSRIGWPVFALSAAIVAYGGWFIYRSSFLVEGKRYFCLFDDAMISMRYAANWAAGNGLVWQPGERVEGYTNLAWTLIMGVVHLFADGPYPSLITQIIGIVVLLGCLAAVLKLGRACGLPPDIQMLAAILALGQWNLLFFTLVGMETGLHTLLITFGLAACVDSLRSGEARVAPLAWLAAAIFVRPDVLILILLTAFAMAIGCRRHRSRILIGLGVVVAVGVGLTLWRYAYYGAWLPNTYYLKATGWPLADRIPIGLRTGKWTVVALSASMVLAVVSLRRFESWRIYLFAAFAAMVAYEVYIGGDAWSRHYRFVVPVSLGLMVLAADGASAIAQYVRGRWRKFVAGGLCLIALASANSLHWRHFLHLERPIATFANQTSVRYAVAVDRVADPSATVAVAWAGAFPYYSKRTCYDLLGKCDAHIARVAATDKIPIAGHNKYDPDYTFSTYKPDLMVDGIRLLRPDQLERFYPVVVTVDGVELLLSIRKGTRKVSGGERVDWRRAWMVFESTPRS